MVCYSRNRVRSPDNAFYGLRLQGKWMVETSLARTARVCQNTIRDDNDGSVLAMRIATDS